MYLERLLPASFRGVPFDVPDHSADVGRRNALFTYPNKDRFFVEDLGRAPRRMRVTAFVIGDDYFAHRNELIEALEAEGPGELVHPYLGRHQVSVVGLARVNESTRQGRVARFDITFVEDGAQPLPRVSESTGEALADAVDAANAATIEDFSESFTTDSQPEFVRDGSLSAVDEVVAKMRDARGRIASSTGIVDDTAEAIDAFSDEAAALILTPRDLASEIVGVVGSVVGAVNQIESAIGSSLQVFDVINETGGDSVEPPATTPSRKTERANRAAVFRVTKMANVAETSRNFTTLDFDSLEQAEKIRDRISDSIDDLLEDENIGDESFAQLKDLRAKLVAHFRTVAGELPRITRYTPPVTMPARLVAHLTTGDARDAEDIVKRNDLAHPGFVPGDLELEILKRD